MKVSELWLREWVDPVLSRAALCENLTMAGLEVEEVVSVADDYVIDISITPNRGDCLSVAGLAQDISAITQTSLKSPLFSKVNSTLADVLPIEVIALEKCPHYIGRIIRNVRSDIATPVWIQERLRRSNIGCIHFIVDVMNYVMLEVGQPMHAFDLQHIANDLQVRMAHPNEVLQLLDGQTVSLDANTLVIADQKKPLAIAGVMGGMQSAVTLLTRDVFLESAFFQPTCITQMSRHYKLISESSYRFERGVDPTLQLSAIERATQLILEIAGGEPGPIVEIKEEQYLPQKKEILLRKTRLSKILGTTFTDIEVENIFQSLGFQFEREIAGWKVVVPPRRFDITLEIDLIEEIIRIYGYDKLSSPPSVTGMQITPCSEKKLRLSTIRHLLCDMGYQEVITYSFIDKKIQQLFDPLISPKELRNPITTDMAVMRTSLWPGLVNAFLYNHNRQQNRVRIFETGLRFIPSNQTASVEQQNVLSGLVSGSVFPEQWGIPLRAIDFFDVKGDIENILKLTYERQKFEFRPGKHSALHPGQTAEIYRLGEYVGILGALHPKIAQQLDIKEKIFIYELLLSPLEMIGVPSFTEISKFPENRRDIAILVEQSIPVSLIQDTIRNMAGELLQNITIFDVYQGKGIKPGYKSVALALTLQHAARTLIEEEVIEFMDNIVVTLKEKFAAELRG